MTAQRRLVHQQGVTIIELMVALAMTALMVSIIFALWGGFGRHVIKQRRKSILHSEIRVVLESLTSHIRRSPSVLAWHASGITYVSPSNDDTIVYEFYADELLKNDAPVTLISQEAYISNFSIEEVEIPVEEKEMTLLAVAISIVDEFGNYVSVRSQVAAKVIDEYAQEEDDELNGWNF